MVLLADRAPRAGVIARETMKEIRPKMGLARRGYAGSYEP